MLKSEDKPQMCSLLGFVNHNLICNLTGEICNCGTNLNCSQGPNSEEFKTTTSCIDTKERIER